MRWREAIGDVFSKHLEPVKMVGRPFGCGIMCNVRMWSQTSALLNILRTSPVPHSGHRPPKAYRGVRPLGLRLQGMGAEIPPC